MVADPLTEPAVVRAVTGKVIVPVTVPLLKVRVNGTVRLVPLILLSEPLATNVPLTAAAPARLRLAFPEIEALVPEIVMGALVTVNVNGTLAACAAMEINRAGNKAAVKRSIESSESRAAQVLQPNGRVALG